MDKIRTYIINFNRLSWMRNMVNYLCQIKELELIIIDNCSTYPPLLDWYNRQTVCEVIRMDKNYGHNVFWERDLLKTATDYYIVTDPDLDLSGIPLDFVEVLKEGLNKYPTHSKCGFGIRIDDFPSEDKRTEYQKRVYEIESRFYNNDFDGRYYYNSAIDTTFALYSKYRINNLTAVRTAAPYVCRHLPFYLTKETLTDEDRYYFATANSSCSGLQLLKQSLDLS